jgi:hypothetical protein
MCFHINLFGGFFLANLTLAIPDSLKKKMDKHSEIRWSNLARTAFEEKLKELDWIDSVLKNSSFSDADAEEIGHKIKAEIRLRFDKRFSA